MPACLRSTNDIDRNTFLLSKLRPRRKVGKKRNPSVEAPLAGPEAYLWTAPTALEMLPPTAAQEWPFSLLYREASEGKSQYNSYPSAHSLGCWSRGSHPGPL